MSRDGWAHQGGLVVFRPTAQELLNIQQFCPKKKRDKIKPILNIQKKLGQALGKINFQ
jgi:hypothetical protein